MQTADRSPAEVMVLPPQAVTPFANTGGQPRRIIPGLYAPGTGVQVVGVEPVDGSVTLPRDFGPAVVVDRSTLGKLGVQVGDRAKINGRTVRVRATLQRSCMTQRCVEDERVLALASRMTLASAPHALELCLCNPAPDLSAHD
jgi:hypothetical protein